MRFAWFRSKQDAYVSQIQKPPHPAWASRLLFNLAFWVFLLPLITPMSYGTGFVLFNGVLAFRVAVNLYTNNRMAQTPEAFDQAPFRIPI